MDALMNILQSAWFKAWIITPLAVVGFYQIFRGVSDILVKDLATKEWPHLWVVIVYVVITILGCVSLIVAL